jgi:hypothetical protein
MLVQVQGRMLGQGLMLALDWQPMGLGSQVLAVTRQM